MSFCWELGDRHTRDLLGVPPGRSRGSGISSRQGKPSGCLAGLTPRGEIRKGLYKEDWVGRCSDYKASLKKSWPRPRRPSNVDCLWGRPLLGRDGQALVTWLGCELPRASWASAGTQQQSPSANSWGPSANSTPHRRFSRREIWGVCHQALCPRRSS